MKALITGGDMEGHALPSLALARAMKERGHDVHVGLTSRWRETIESSNVGFVELQTYVPFPAAALAESSPTVVDEARRLARVIAELDCDIVVSDFVSPAPALAAEIAGVPDVTLIPTLYPVRGDGLPPFALGLLPPRHRPAAALWDLVDPGLRRLRHSTRWVDRVPELLDQTRSQLGLGPALRDRHRTTTFGTVSERLALVATFPQLEYQRRWPDDVHVTGPMRFDLDEPQRQLPEGDEPLVLIAPSTVPDPGFNLVRASVEALAGEPVRVLATLNRRGEHWRGPAPANATIVDWVSYAQAMPKASMAITSGGLGTISRALSEGVPVLVCPTEADTAENGARVTWAGVGLSLPRRLRSAAALRRSVRLILGEPAFETTGSRAR